MRTTATPAKLFPAILASLALALLAPPVAAAAGEAPVKESLSSHIGWEANKNGTSICSVVLKEECQPGKPSGEPGGFLSPIGVAVNDDSLSSHYHHLYVVDTPTHRVQELTASGQFVSTFGWEVNKTEDETLGATQAEKNFCTATSGDTCKAGVAGVAPGQLSDITSVAVDPTSGNIYTAEYVLSGGSLGERVQEFTPDGAFVLEIGSEVNQTAAGTPGASEEQKNLCTAQEVAEGATCTGPRELSAGKGSQRTRLVRI